MLTRSFSATINDKEVSLFVKAPSLQDQREATKVYNQNFSEALKAKAVVRAKLDDVLMEQGLWDANKQAQFTKVQNDILEGERKLAKGGISILEAKKVALNMKKSRDDLRDLIAVKTNLDTHTAEGQADNARFNYLVSACTVYTDTKEQYFKNYEDYLNRSSDPVAILAAQNLAGMLYGLENDYESKLPENRFLKQYKFVDDQLRLINKNSHLVDDDGRLVDENGRYVNDKGEFVDKDGNPVDNQGDYLLDFQPFLDENGQPIILDTENRNDNTTKETSSSSSSAN